MSEFPRVVRFQVRWVAAREGDPGTGATWTPRASTAATTAARRALRWDRP